jgi:aryl-alcohol dehydrogenase-like predicted oxidoreductase
VRAPALLDNPRAFDTVQKLQGIATELSVPLSQLALAWVIQQPVISSAISGPRTLEQFEDNLKARELTLSAEVQKRIDAVVPRGSHVVPFYDAEFGAGPYRW